MECLEKLSEKEKITFFEYQKDNDGDTPMMHATKRSDAELVTFYVEKGSSKMKMSASKRK